MPAAAPITDSCERRPRTYVCLERLLKQIELVRAEILSCSASCVPMPVERRQELEAAFEGLCTEAQPYWEGFTDEDHAAVMRARARVIGNRPVGMIPSTRRWP